MECSLLLIPYNTLCQALVPHDQAPPTATIVPSATFSLIKKAKLCGTYFKQLRNLFDQGILTEVGCKEKEDLVVANNLEMSYTHNVMYTISTLKK